MDGGPSSIVIMELCLSLLVRISSCLRYTSLPPWGSFASLLLDCLSSSLLILFVALILVSLSTSQESRPVTRFCWLVLPAFLSRDPQFAKSPCVDGGPSSIVIMKLCLSPVCDMRRACVNDDSSPIVIMK